VLRLCTYCNFGVNAAAYPKQDAMKVIRLKSAGQNGHDA